MALKSSEISCILKIQKILGPSLLNAGILLLQNVYFRIKRESRLSGEVDGALAAHGRLDWLEAIGNQATEQIDEQMRRFAVVGGLNLTDILELIIDGLNDRPFANENLLQQRHQPICPVLG